MEPDFGDVLGIRDRRLPGRFGVNGVFVFISGAMAIVMVAIGVLGPKTRDVALEDISK